MQLFLMTGDYFLNSIKFPGGIIGYIGEFITQFYHISLIGSLFINLLLLSIQQLSLKILYAVRRNNAFFLLSFIPALISWIMLGDEYYLISGLIGFMVVLLFARLYISIRQRNQRALSGLFMIPLVYMVCGGAYLVFVAIAGAFELFKTDAMVAGSVSKSGTPSESGHTQRISIWYLIAFLLFAVLIPLGVKRFFIQENTLQAYMSEFYYNILSTNLITPIPPAIFFLFVSVPLLMLVFRFWHVKEKRSYITFVCTLICLIILGYFSLKRNMDFYKEEIMTYDHMARNEQWYKIIAFAEKRPPTHYMSLCMLNLALAKTGQLPERMFHYAQHYAFESLTKTPHNKQNVRSIKRLAETNLINGDYKVAEKYLNLLESTLFYHKWAKDKRKLLYKEELIGNDPVYSEKRRHLLKNDFFLNANDMETALRNVLIEDPQHKMAFEYLMAYYLINKYLENFVASLYLLDGMHYAEIPKSYQEVIYYVESLPDFSLPVNKYYPISFDVMNRMQNYAYIYSNYQNAQATLRNLFSDTYWYYLHFIYTEQDDLRTR